MIGTSLSPLAYMRNCTANDCRHWCSRSEGRECPAQLPFKDRNNQVFRQLPKHALRQRPNRPHGAGASLPPSVRTRWFSGTVQWQFGYYLGHWIALVIQTSHKPPNATSPSSFPHEFLLTPALRMSRTGHEHG